MAVFAATPRSTRIFLSLAAASEVSSAATTSTVTHRGKCTGARRDGGDAEAPTPSTRRRRRATKKRRRCCGASCKGELCCCVKRCCFKAGVPPLTCCESFVDKEVCCQCGLCCCALGCKCPSTCIKHQGQCCCVVNNIACPCDEEVPLTCALCFFACHPHCGICVRTNAHWPYHRAPGGAPPAIEVMDGKEEVFVVEAQPGSVSAVASLESLDVVDKLPDSVVTPFAMDVMER